MLDSKADPGSSQFVSRTDRTLRFSLKAFQFTSDPETEVSDAKNPPNRTAAHALWVVSRSIFTARCLSHLRLRALLRSPAPTGTTGTSGQPQIQDPSQVCAVFKCTCAMTGGQSWLVSTPYVNAAIHDAWPPNQVGPRWKVGLCNRYRYTYTHLK